jgi:hypothetical protein
MYRTLAVFFFLIGTTWAGPTLTFALGAGGTASYAGGATPIIAADIPVSSLIGAGTPMHNSEILGVTNGILSFTTGDYTDSHAGILDFAGSGSFVITGSIASVGLFNATLLTGDFFGASFDPTVGSLDMFLGTGQDTKNQALVDYYFGVGSSVTWNFSGNEYVEHYRGAGKVENTGFNLGGLSGSVVNTATSVTNPSPIVAETPEPSSIALFGTTAAALAYLALRRRRAA